MDEDDAGSLYGLDTSLSEDDGVMILPRDADDWKSENIRLIRNKRKTTIDRNSSPDIPPTVRHIAAPDRIKNGNNE